MGLFFSDIFDHIVRIQYGIAQREDITVTFTEPTSAAAVHELQNLPGVQYVEPFRSVPVRFHHAHRSYDAGIEGVPKDRSEEHTSELQSRGQLVCRLLLEKKQ